MTPAAVVPRDPCANASKATSRAVEEPQRVPGDRRVCRDLGQFDAGWEALRQTRGDALVLGYAPTFPGLDTLLREIAKVEGVQAAEPFVVFEARLFSDEHMLAIPVQGRGQASMDRLAAFVSDGTLVGLDKRDVPRGIALGRELATMLGVNVGDEIGVWPSPLEVRLGGNDTAPRLERARVAAVLSFPEGDALSIGANEVVMGLGPAVELWEQVAGRGSGPTGVALFFRDGVATDDTLRRVEQALGDPVYRVISQQELNKGAKESARMLRVWCGRER